jgi:hypothetical protein
MHALHLLGRVMFPAKSKLTKFQQWAATGLIVVLAGIPFTPVSHYKEHVLMELLPTHPTLAGAIMVLHFGISVALIRFLFLNVLNTRRFYGSVSKKIIRG